MSSLRSLVAETQMEKVAMAQMIETAKRVLSAGIVAVGFMFATEAAQAGDAKNGQQVFMDTCSVCHDAKKGGPNKVGPNLFAVVGRQSAAASGYMYSPAMTKAALTWDEPTLQVFLAGPQKKVPGTKMSLPRFSDPADEGDLIAYLVSLK
jgi:cytochrome c